MKKLILALALLAANLGLAQGPAARRDELAAGTQPVAASALTGTASINTTGNSAGATNAPDGRLLGYSPVLRHSQLPDLGVSRDNNDPGDFHGNKTDMALADAGYFNLAFVTTEYTNENAAATIDVMLNAYGYESVPVGVSTNMRYVAGDNRWHHLATNANLPYPPFSIYNSNYPSSTAVTRRGLALSATSNFIYKIEGSLREWMDVEKSGADSISSMTGSNLLALKCKYIFVNGGKMITDSSPDGINTYGNYNFEVDIEAARYCISNAVVPLVFNPVSVSNVLDGDAAMVGQNLMNTELHPPDLPLFQLSTNLSAIARPMWDLWANLFVAASSGKEHFTMATNWHDGTPLFRLVGPGRAEVDVNGRVIWYPDGIVGLPTNHYYLVTNGFYSANTGAFVGGITNFGNALLDASPVRAGTKQNQMQNRNRPFVLENFGLGANVSTPGTAGIGQCNWVYYGNSSGSVSTRRLSGAFGVGRLLTAASSGTVAGFGAQYDTAAGTGSYDLFVYGWEAKFRIYLNETNDVFHRFGFLGLTSTGPTTNEVSGVYLRHRSSTDGSTWKFVCRASAGGSETVLNSTVPVTAGTWHTVRIRRGYPPYANGIYFSMDGEREQFTTANLPNWSVPAHLAGTEAAAAKTVYIDWLRLDDAP